MLVRVLAATVAGGIAMFGLGFVIYGLLLDPYLKANMVQYAGLIKEPIPDMVLLVAANMVNALLFAFVFDKWASIRTFVGGLKGGAIIGFLMAATMDLNFYAFMNLWKGPIPVIVDVLAATVLTALAGGVIGAVLGLMNKEG